MINLLAPGTPSICITIAIDMAQTIFSRQLDRKFISENNPNNRRYTGRLTKNEITQLKPMLLSLHYQGSTRDVMLKRASELLGKDISMPQLDLLREKLGLLSGRQKQPDAHVGFLDDRGNLNANRQPEQSGSVATPIAEKGSRETVNSHASRDASMLDAEDPGSTGDDSEASLVVDDGDSSINATPKADILTTPRLERTRPGTLHQDTCFIINDVDEPLGHHSASEDAAEIQAWIEGKSWGDATSSAISSSVDVTIPEGFEIRFTPWNPPNTNRLASPTGCPMTRTYFPSVSALRLYTIGAGGLDSNEEQMARLSQIALLLHTLRAFDKAFDLFFIIFRHFCKRKTRSNQPHPQLILSAINCVRSAQTKIHLQVAGVIVGKVRSTLMGFYGSDVNDRTPAWQYLGMLRDHFFNSANSDRNLPPESTKETAYWTVSTLAISHQTFCRDNAISLDDFTTFWHIGARALEHLCECHVTRSVISNALSVAYSYFNKHAELVNVLLDRPWESLFTNSSKIAQILSCLLLEDHARQSAALDDFVQQDHSSHDDHGDFPCDLNGHALAIVSFGLVEWIRKFELSTVNSDLLFTTEAIKRSPTEHLQFGAEQIHFDIQSSSSKYTDFVEICLDQLAPPEATPPQAGSIISSDRLFGISAAMAGLVPITDALGIWHTKCAEHPRSPQQTTPPEVSQEKHHEKHQADSCLQTPTLASSIRSSSSSSYWSFQAVSRRARESVAASVHTQNTRLSDQRNSSNSLTFSMVAGYSSGHSMHESFRTSSSDVTMSG